MHTWRIDTAAKRLLYHTVRVDTTLADGSSGTGTAFAVAHTHALGRSLFVVTNRHIVEDVVAGALVLAIEKDGAPVLGSRFELRIEDFTDAWMLHPDPAVDLAIMPLQPLLDAAALQGVRVFVQPIDTRRIPSAEVSAGFDALQDVLFIGYPSGVWDQVNGMPILRRGITATPPALDFEGRAEFLIDAAVYPGSSGSPVFMPVPDGQGGTDLWFAGVVAAVFFREEANRLVSAPVPASTAQTVMGSEMIDLGLVVKSSQVRSLIDAYLAQWTA